MTTNEVSSMVKSAYKKRTFSLLPFRGYVDTAKDAPKEIEEYTRKHTPPPGQRKPQKSMDEVLAGLEQVIKAKKSDKAPEASGGKPGVDMIQATSTVGGALLAHALATALLEGSGGKKKQTPWIRALSAIAPFAAAGLGAYGGWSLTKKSEDDAGMDEKSINAALDAALQKAEDLTANRNASVRDAVYSLGGAVGTGLYSKHVGKKYIPARDAAEAHRNKQRVYEANKATWDTDHTALESAVTTAQTNLANARNAEGAASATADAWGGGGRRRGGGGNTPPDPLKVTAFQNRGTAQAATANAETALAQAQANLAAHNARAPQKPLVDTVAETPGVVVRGEKGPAVSRWLRTKRYGANALTWLQLVMSLFRARDAVQNEEARKSLENKIRAAGFGGDIPGGVPKND